MTNRLTSFLGRPDPVPDAESGYMWYVGELLRDHPEHAGHMGVVELADGPQHAMDLKTLRAFATWAERRGYADPARTEAVFKALRERFPEAW